MVRRLHLKGQVVCVIGPSGSGKSTLLRCINRLEEPTRGDITVDDIMITNPKYDINKVRRHIGMVFQQFNLFPHLSVKENIMMAPLELKLKSEKSEDQRIPGEGVIGVAVRFPNSGSDWLTV